MRFIFASLALALALAGLTAAPAIIAGESCGSCPQCGCCNINKVCKLVPVVTKVPMTEYFCQCGDVCVPGHSKCVGTECVTDCDGCTHNQKVYQPSCGKIYQTVTPGKKTTMVEKCSYKCVVEYTCCHCGCCCGKSEAHSDGK